MVDSCTSLEVKESLVKAKGLTAPFIHTLHSTPFVTLFGPFVLTPSLSTLFIYTLHSHSPKETDSRGRTVAEG